MSSPTRYRTRRRASQVLLTIVLLLVGVVMMAPLVWMVSMAFIEPTEAFQLPPSWLPIPFTFQNLLDVTYYIPFWQMAANSALIAIISVVGSLAIASLAAYAFSRVRFAGSRWIFVLFLAALMVPLQLTIIPLFVLMRTLGLVNTLPAVWLPALINVFAIFFLKQYFDTIPRELDEAARIDGAGHVRILFRIILPLAGPAVSALAILGFEASWNSYFVPLIFLNSPENQTLPLGLVGLSGGLSASSAVLFAGITMVVVPIFVLFMIFQRKIVESVASVGLRG